MTLIDLVAHLLPAADREAVLGDLAETNATPAQSLRAILSLITYRQLSCWRSWRPWLAAFGIGFPIGYLLTGSSVGLALSIFYNSHLLTIEHTHPTLGDAALIAINLSIELFTLAVPAFAAGIAAVSLSRRTLWTSILAAVGPSICCLTKFHVADLSPISLFLFIPPAAAGVLFALRGKQLPLWLLLFFVVPYTLLTLIPPADTASLAFRIGQIAALVLPCWYIVWRSISISSHHEGNLSAL